MLHVFVADVLCSLKFVYASAVCLTETHLLTEIIFVLYEVVRSWDTGMRNSPNLIFIPKHLNLSCETTNKHGQYGARGCLTVSLLVNF